MVQFIKGCMPPSQLHEDNQTGFPGQLQEPIDQLHHCGQTKQREIDVSPSILTVGNNGGRREKETR